MKKDARPCFHYGREAEVNNDILLALASIDGVRHCVLLTPEADTLFSPSLMEEKNSADMELFVSMLNMINELRFDQNNQIKSAKWKLEHGCFIIALIREHTFLVQYQGKLECEVFYDMIASTLETTINENPGEDI